MANDPSQVPQLPISDPNTLSRLAVMFNTPNTMANQSSYDPTKDISAATAFQTEKTPEAYQATQDIKGQLDKAMAAQAALQPPKFGPESTLGKVLYAIGGLFKPGQAVERGIYGPGIEKYAAERGAIAQQIAGLRGEQEEAGKTLTTVSDVGSKALQAGGMYGRGVGAQAQGQAAQERAAAFSRDVNRKIDAQQFINQLNMTREQATAAEAALKRAMPVILQNRINAELRGQDVTMQTREDVTNALIQAGVQKETPLLDRATNFILGEGFLPTVSQAPGGSQPVSGKQPLPQRTPPRPKGVPADAKYDAKTNTWYK